MVLFAGYSDILFENKPLLNTSNVLGTFYLCMSGPKTLATDIYSRRSLKYDIPLFNNKEVAKKIIKRRQFSNNIPNNEFIIRFQLKDEPHLNFYSGSRLRNTEYLNESNEIIIEELGINRFSETLSNSVYQLSLDATYTGSYSNGTLTVQESNVRGTFLITNSIIDTNTISTSFQEEESSSSFDSNLSMIEATETEMPTYLGGNTVLLRDPNINFRSRTEFVLFGNVLEYPSVSVPYIFETPSLYLHNNVVSSTITALNLTNAATKDIYKNKFSDYPIINYNTYFPITYEHTVQHHNHNLSLVDDVMEDLSLIHRRRFDSNIPFDTNSFFDSKSGIPFLLKEAMQEDIFEFERKGTNNKGDAGAICLSYIFPQESTINIETEEDLEFLNEYLQIKMFDIYKNLIEPKQLRQHLKLIIKNNINIDLFLKGLWMGRHSSINIEGCRNSLIPNTLPIISGRLKTIDGNLRFVLNNLILDTVIHLGGAEINSDISISKSILTKNIKIDKNWNANIVGNTSVIV